MTLKCQRYLPLEADQATDQDEDAHQHCHSDNNSNGDACNGDNKRDLGTFLCWRDQVVLSHCRIGHLWLTHAFFLKGEPVPKCIGCQSPLTIKHILLNCVDFMALRQQFYTANSMHELFTKVKQEHILAFLSAAGLYHLI